jgi:superfamily II DNA or RNA helicase
MTPNQFLKTKLPKEYHLLIDEFHNSFFNDGIFDLLPLFNQATTLMGLSGSPLQKDNISFI